MTSGYEGVCSKASNLVDLSCSFVLSSNGPAFGVLLDDEFDLLNWSYTIDATRTSDGQKLLEQVTGTQTNPIVYAEIQFAEFTAPFNSWIDTLAITTPYNERDIICVFEIKND